MESQNGLTLKERSGKDALLLPYLFNIYTEDIMRNVEEDGKTVNFDELNIQGHKIRDPCYVDDTSLLSHSVRGSSILVEEVDKHSRKKCLNLNAKIPS